MSEAKINITIGSMEFSGEGTPEWLERQLDKLLAVAPELMKVKAENPQTNSGADATNGGISTNVVALATFLKGKKDTSNQVRRFLATAQWLHLKGQNRHKAGDVAKALSAANQPRLTNPADALNQNVAKGHCEKEGGLFFVTPEGIKALG